MKSDNFKNFLPDFSQYEKFPSWKQWKQLPRVLTKFDKFALILFVVLLIGSAGILASYHTYKNTVSQPARGGTFIEGMTGQPRFINPVYISSNDVDRSLIQLTFAGLMQYENGEIVYDLAKSYHTEEGKVWTVTLKDDITWQDGKPITAEDVVFTVNVLQSSEYKSPQRINWVGVDVSRVSPRKVKFKLNNAYPQFLENLTLKIIPKHIWGDIQPADFSLSSYNLKPIGSGPYRIKKVDRQDNHINSLTLVRNPNYHEQPYVDKIKFHFFDNESQLVRAAEKRQIDGFSSTASPDFNDFKAHQFSLPRYFAVFFNPDQSEILESKEVRRALNHATNRQAIVNQVLDGRGNICSSPILPSIFGYQKPKESYSFNLKKANKLLKEAGFVYSNGDGIREKKKEKEFEFTQRLQNGAKNKSVEELQKCLVKEVGYKQKNVTGYFGNKTKEAVIKFQEKYEEDVLQSYDLQSGTGVVGPSTQEKLNQVCFEQPTTPLKIKLTLVDQPEMNQVAEALQQQWKKAGVKLKTKSVPLSELKTKHIKTRNYESLLFGQSLGIKPDFYSFWHSSQAKHPGLNLAKFDSDKADELLKKGRSTLNDKERTETYENFQQELLKEAPAVFLYNPNFTYYTSDIKGVRDSLIVNPAHRFNSVKEWYLNTKRVWR